MSPSDSGSEIFYGETCAQRSVFLAGPTLRKPGAGWRRDAVGMLRAAGYQTDIVLPEWRHAARMPAGGRSDPVLLPGRGSRDPE
jgi:hypothetical protein